MTIALLMPNSSNTIQALPRARIGEYRGSWGYDTEAAKKEEEASREEEEQKNANHISIDVGSTANVAYLVMTDAHGDTAPTKSWRRTKQGTRQRQVTVGQATNSAPFIHTC